MKGAQRWAPSEHWSLAWDGQRLRKPQRPGLGQPPDAHSYRCPLDFSEVLCCCLPAGLNSTHSQRKPRQSCPKSLAGGETTRAVCKAMKLEGSYPLSNLTSSPGTWDARPVSDIQQLLECLR